MVQSLVILGTGGGALDILDIVDAINVHAINVHGTSVQATDVHAPIWKVAGFLDDARPAGSAFLGLPVLGPVASAARLDPEVHFLNAIGSDRSHRQRPAIVGATGVANDRFATLVHPRACVSPRCRLGRGVTVNAGVSLAGQVVVGDHATLGAGAIVGHDAAIDDFAIIAPGAVISGAVRIGRSSYVGAGASLRQRVEVGAGALVGMGAVVLNHVAAGDRVVGCPARSINAPLPTNHRLEECARS
jgi:sugar O-acyltransferase (sialic acid O-acetyltransferase NeuD family)